MAGLLRGILGRVSDALTTGLPFHVLSYSYTALTTSLLRIYAVYFSQTVTILISKKSPEVSQYLVEANQLVEWRAVSLLVMFSREWRIPVSEIASGLLTDTTLSPITNHLLPMTVSTCHNGLMSSDRIRCSSPSSDLKRMRLNLAMNAENNGRNMG